MLQPHPHMRRRPRDTLGCAQSDETSLDACSNLTLAYWPAEPNIEAAKRAAAQ
jgi:hypothetical protein